MSALSDLSVELKQFWELPHHNDPKLATKLAEVQSWQKTVFAIPMLSFFLNQNKPMADYFLTHLYGGDS